MGKHLTEFLLLMILYWIVAGSAAGATVSYFIKARQSRKAYTALKPGQKVWLNTLARAQRG